MSKPPVNCPHCAVALVEGFVLDHGHGDTRRIGVWVEGTPEMTFFGNAKVDNRANYYLEAFRCPQCGLVQMYANDRTYAGG
jgi:hypothetical protein